MAAKRSGFQTSDYELYLEAIRSYEAMQGHCHVEHGRNVLSYYFLERQNAFFSIVFFESQDVRTRELGGLVVKRDREWHIYKNKLWFF